MTQRSRPPNKVRMLSELSEILSRAGSTQLFGCSLVKQQSLDSYLATEKKSSLLALATFSQSLQVSKNYNL